MAKARKADDLLADLDSLGSEEQAAPTTSHAKTSSTSKSAPKPATTKAEDDENSFGELEKMLAAKPAGSSRPTTPRMSSSTTSATGKAVHTPASSSDTGSQRTSEEKLRNQQVEKGAELTAPVSEKAQAPTSAPAPAAQSQATPAQGGGWWGSMFSAATAAVKQAENLAKEIRGNEEAIKWAESVRGYGAGLSNLSTDLRSKALPTFTSLISHIAPPISAHERLQIHTTHDIAHYPSLDPLIYSTFSRVMSQVEGGDLLVIQRGSESRARSSSEQQGYRGNILGTSGGGWTDGPWWRDEGAKRDLGTVVGLKEGTRLARVSAEAYAREFFEGRGGVEAAAKAATETLSESNPTRSSDIFLAIQAISYQAEKELFAGDAREAAEGKEEGGVHDPTEDEVEDLIVFAIYLHDPLHSLSFATLSQPFPQKWASWLDASPTPSEEGNEAGLPESILEIIQSGGVDPREWVSEWMEEILSLGVGVVAQRYVARRMGVGEGGIGRGKRRASVEDMSGEAARVL